MGPKRIVCLTEETTELLYLLGEQNRIVGISAYTVRPEIAKKEKPVVSAFISGNIEKIKSLKPDLVIGFSDIQAELASQLVKEGLNVLILNQRSIAEIYEAMNLIGSLVQKTSETQKLIKTWKKKIDSIAISNHGKARPRIFFQEWDDPIITGINWVSELIELAGGEDCFKNLSGRGLAKNRIVSAEQVAEAMPDAIIGSWCGKAMKKDWVQTKPEWKNTPAIERQKIFEIHSSIILQPGPALFLEGIDALKAAIDDSRLASFRT